MMRNLRALFIAVVLAAAFTAGNVQAAAAQPTQEASGRLYEQRAVGRIEYDRMKRLLYDTYEPSHFRYYPRHPYSYYQRRFYYGHPYYGYRYPYGYKYPRAYRYPYGYRWPYYSDPYDYFAVPPYIGPDRFYRYPRGYYRYYPPRDWYWD